MVAAIHANTDALGLRSDAFENDKLHGSEPVGLRKLPAGQCTQMLEQDPLRQAWVMLPTKAGHGRHNNCETLLLLLNARQSLDCSSHLLLDGQADSRSC